MLGAWELGNHMCTIGKVFLYSLKKHSVYALLNQAVRSYGQKYMTWYFDLFLTHICVFRVLRVKDTFENDFQCSKQLWITFKHHFQSFWPVWSLQKKFENFFLTLSARSLLKIVDFLRIIFFWNCKLQNVINACSLRVRQPFWHHWKGIFILFKKSIRFMPF